MNTFVYDSKGGKPQADSRKARRHGVCVGPGARWVDQIDAVKREEKLSRASLYRCAKCWHMSRATGKVFDEEWVDGEQGLARHLLTRAIRVVSA
jgi:hypothetical protein